MAKQSRTKYAQYEPGDMVGVPLQGGGWGAALIARRPASERPPNALVACWGFDRLFDEQPTWEECRHLTLFDAAVFHKCGDLSIAEGLWPVLGHMERFEPTEWPIPSTTFVHILGDSHPIEPRRQRVIITEDVELCCVNIANEGYVSPDRYHWLPWGLGLGGRDMLSYAISNAVKKRHPAYYCRPTPEIVAVWNTCIERVKQAGLFPVAEPRR
jgi:hypothetical protein